MKNNRRRFLSTLGKATFLGMGVLTLSGCFSNKERHAIRNNSGKKKEILYARSKTWDLYYKRAY